MLIHCQETHLDLGKERLFKRTIARRGKGSRGSNTVSYRECSLVMSSAKIWTVRLTRILSCGEEWIVWEEWTVGRGMKGWPDRKVHQRVFYHIFRWGYMLAQAEGMSKFRSLGKERKLTKVSLISIFWSMGQIVQPVLWKAKKGNMEDLCLALSEVNSLWILSKSSGERTLCSKPFPRM